jgi:hypothetical protein
VLTESLLYRKIHEQPHVLGCILETERDYITQLAPAIWERQVSHEVVVLLGGELGQRPRRLFAGDSDSISR